MLQQTFHHTEEEVCVDVPLMDLVNDDDIVLA